MHLILAIMGFAVFLSLVVGTQHMAREKGYRSPWAWVGPLLNAFLAFIVSLAIVDEYEARAISGYLYAAKLIAPPLFLLLLWLVVFVLLPKKNPRRPGRRRVVFPYRPVGASVVVIGLVVIIAGSVVRIQLGVVGILLALAGAAFFLVGLHARKPTLDETLRADSRPPVLYLRPFIADHPSAFSFEAKLSEAIERKIGPMVALGNPGDYVPPEGAARSYVDDENWQEEFARLAETAACIVLLMGVTESVVWELNYLKAAGLQHKLIVVSGPKRWLNRRLRGQRVCPWDRFVATLDQSGYRVASRDPGPGMLLAFDRKSRGILLGRGMSEAARYVEAMQTYMGARLDSKRRGGHSRRVSQGSSPKSGEGGPDLPEEITRRRGSRRLPAGSS